MKKFVVLFVIVAVAVFAFAFNRGPVSASAPAPAWMDSHYVVGKGIVFDFAYYGNPKYLHGPNVHGAFIIVHGSKYPLSCWLNTEKTMIVCTLGGSLTQYAGEIGSISLLDRWYNVIIPSKSEKIYQSTPVPPTATPIPPTPTPTLSLGDQ